MPKIIVQADQPSAPGHTTLSERIAAAHLFDDHYAAQLIERLTWAAADAEALEAQAPAAEAIAHRAPSRQRGPQARARVDGRAVGRARPEKTFNRNSEVLSS
jgi:hypothetical protein